MSEEQTSSEKVTSTDLLRMATDVVASYVSKNSVGPDQLPDLINSVHATLKAVDGRSTPVPELPLKPAVPIRRSVQPDYIVCLEDGKKLKMLKRHLRTTYDMTPDEYRAKWSLAPDYPMVAPNYAAQRSAFAKKIGLGRGARGATRKKSK
ncbi:MAG: MucR family transcriptional regulator [Alphaproteobacteria bacterium]